MQHDGEGRAALPQVWARFLRPEASLSSYGECSIPPMPVSLWLSSSLLTYLSASQAAPHSTLPDAPPQTPALSELGHSAGWVFSNLTQT